MVQHVEEAFRKSKVNLPVLLSKLMDCTAVQGRNVPLFTQGLFDEVKSIERLFQILSGYWHLYDYRILRFLIQTTECEEAKQIFDAFLSDFKCSAISNPPRKLRCRISPSSNTLWVKIAQHEYTAEMENKIRGAICKSFGLKENALILKDIKESCTELVYQISSPVKYYMLQNKLSIHDISQLKSRNITILKLDDDAELTVPSEFSNQVNMHSFFY